MPTRDEIVAAVETYVRMLDSHNTDTLMELFADGAVQHEPVGIRTNKGNNEIRAFFAENENTPFRVSLLTPVTVAGRFAAAMMRVRLDGLEDFGTTDLFEFDDSCKIVSITAVPDVKAVVE